MISCDMQSCYDFNYILMYPGRLATVGLSIVFKVLISENAHVSLPI